VNARLSPRSERRYRKFNVFIRPVFKLLNLVLVQESEDVARWAALGVASGRIEHTGSIKFDMQGQPELTEKIGRFSQLLESTGWTSSRPVLLAASTHDGEEIEIAKVFRQLRTHHRDLFLIIVPRHVERAVKIENELQGMGLNILRRSLIENGSNEKLPVDVLLVDTTGELRAWQYLATVVVIGKSFLAVGGQNPAEALMAGKPVLFGPHMENFEALVKMLLHKNGAVEVRDFAELTDRVLGLLDNRINAEDLAAAGLEALREHEGATQRVAAKLLQG
jgi:3-deoxy-D-manno-octulosonic-acid transferase